MDSRDSVTPTVISETPPWLVVAKPAGWLTIPGRDNSSVLQAWVQSHFGKVWVVHRLDRDTSGVLLFARTAQAHRLANTWFQKHEVKKIYECLAHGIPAMPVFKIQRAVSSMPSITQVEVLKSCSIGFLAQVRPITGRRHQIRIHLSKEGFPLWGDAEYGGKTEIQFGSNILKINRVALHARSLELPSGDRFEAPWPDDFKGWVEGLRRA